LSWIGPNIGGIVRDKNRDVAYQLNTPLRAVSFQREPLAKKKKLIKLLRCDLVRESVSRILKSRWPATDEVRGPVIPGDSAVFILQGAEQSIIVEPRRMSLAEFRQAIGEFTIGAAGKRVEGELQQRLFVFVDCREIYAVGWRFGCVI
jgi:hypothetical protein